MRLNATISLGLLILVALVAFAASSGLVLTEGQLHLHSATGCRWVWRVPGMCVRSEFFCTRTHCPGGPTACKSNLKNIGTALEMYSTDHRGAFPASLDQLVPTYLEAIPTCPQAGADTYTDRFQVSATGYTVVCGGHWHCGVGYSMNYPQYTSTQGLLER